MEDPWEYWVETSRRHLPNSSLNTIGRGGWELVSHVVKPGRTESRPVLAGEKIVQSDPLHIYTFKRRKQQK